MKFKKLSDWIFYRLEKSLYFDRDKYEHLLKLAREEKAKGN